MSMAAHQIAAETLDHVDPIGEPQDHPVAQIAFAVFEDYSISQERWCLTLVWFMRSVSPLLTALPIGNALKVGS